VADLSQDFSALGKCNADLIDPRRFRLSAIDYLLAAAP
jgi:hypothetical protein